MRFGKFHDFFLVFTLKDIVVVCDDCVVVDAVEDDGRAVDVVWKDSICARV